MVAFPAPITANQPRMAEGGTTNRTRLIGQAEKDLLRARIAAYPQQPSTSDGLQAYRQQMREWLSLYPTLAKPTIESGFPLRPGTSPVCSGECWNCGKSGHGKDTCTATKETGALSAHERSFRALCTTILGRITNPPQATLVAQVYDTDDEFALLDDGFLSGQGKEQGLSL